MLAFICYAMHDGVVRKERIVQVLLVNINVRIRLRKAFFFRVKLLLKSMLKHDKMKIVAAFVSHTYIHTYI